MSFSLDPRLETSSICLLKGPLSNLYMKDVREFPWFILVPRLENISEIHQLTSAQQGLLMMEIATISRGVSEYFKPDKVNVGALGNIVNQFHVHIVARFKEDSLWPQGIWQDNPAVIHTTYSKDDLLQWVPELKKYFSGFSIFQAE